MERLSGLIDRVLHSTDTSFKIEEVSIACDIFKKKAKEHAFSKLKAMLLAPYVVAFKRTDDKLHFVPEYRWMETIDWPLTGDAPWQRRYEGKNLKSWWLQVLWIWRNGAQKMSYVDYGIPASLVDRIILLNGSVDNPDFTMGHKTRILLDKAGRVVGFYVKECTPLKWLPGRYKEVMVGWKVNNPVPWTKAQGGDDREYIKIINSTRFKKLPDDPRFDSYRDVIGQLRQWAKDLF